MSSCSGKDREYYEKRKIEFANQFAYSGDTTQKFGEEYGYTLKPAYTEEEVSEYENKYNIRLPQIFREYLINISRETLGRYPRIFDLQDGGPFKSYFKGSREVRDCLCDDFDAYGHNCDSPDDLDLDLLSEDELLTNRIIINYFVCTHDNGCTDDTYLCVKGDHYGNEASYKDGGDYFSLG